MPAGARRIGLAVRIPRDHADEPVVQVRVESPQTGRRPMGGVEVGDVLAVRIVRLAGGPVPHNSEPRKRGRADRYQPPEKPELQEVAQITGIAILHVPHYASTVTALVDPPAWLAPAAWRTPGTGCGSSSNTPTAASERGSFAALTVALSAA